MSPSPFGPREKIRIWTVFSAGLVALLVARSGFSQTVSSLAPRDPQGVSILTQVLNTAGGTTAIAAVQDFVATGNVTYNLVQPVQGSATIKGRGLHEFRLDATLPDGVHSWIVNSNAAFQKNPDGSTSPLPSQITIKIASTTFPLIEVLAAIQDTSFSISYGGVVTHDGQQAHDILVQKTLPPGSDPLGAVSAATTAHIYVNPNAFTVESIEDSAYPKDNIAGQCSHEMQFSGYQTANGVLAPFSATELVAGQQTMSIQLNQITFNNGLTDSAFQ